MWRLQQGKLMQENNITRAQNWRFFMIFQIDSWTIDILQKATDDKLRIDTCISVAIC